MVRVLVAVAIVALLAVIGIYRFGGEPLDARAVVDAGVEQVKQSTPLDTEQEMLLRVQLAISDYMAINGNPPDSLTQLVPKYFDSEPKNPATGEPFEYKREGRSPRIGGQIGRVNKPKAGKGAADGITGPELVPVKGEDFVNPNTMVMDDFTYDKTGRRNPFEAFDFSEPVTPVDPANPLTGYTIGQLRVTAIIVGFDGKRKANVENNIGQGFIAKEGTKIGKNGGVVASVEPDRLTIVETQVDFTGKESQKTIEMKIVPSGPAGQKKAPAKVGKR